MWSPKPFQQGPRADRWSPLMQQLLGGCCQVCLSVWVGIFLPRGPVASFTLPSGRDRKRGHSCICLSVSVHWQQGRKCLTSEVYLASGRRRKWENDYAQHLKKFIFQIFILSREIKTDSDWARSPVYWFGMPPHAGAMLAWSRKPRP